MKSNSLKKLVVAVALAGPMTAMAGKPVMVDDAASLSEALAAGESKIMIKNGAVIETCDTLIFDGTSLSIDGKGSTIQALEGCHDTLLRIENASNISIKNLEFIGNDSYSIGGESARPGEQLADKSQGKGIEIIVDEAASGMINVSLTNVSVYGVGNHGVYVRDCTFDDCGNGNESEAAGSEGSVMMRLNGVNVDNVGFGKQDGDGVRVDERGEGSVFLSVTNSTFSNAGGDGIELDEAGEGDVEFSVRNAEFLENGAYCSPAYNGFDDVDSIFALDEACNDDDEADVDDAFDIDEADGGWMRGSVTNVTIIHSYDEGLDFDTADEGGADIDIVNLYEEGNDGDVIKVSEEGEGSVGVRIVNIDVESEVQIEEEDEGDISVSVTNASIASEDDGDLKITENGDGSLQARVNNSFMEKDVEIIEEDDGDLDASITNSDIGDDLEVSQQAPGTGVLDLGGTTIADKQDIELGL